MEVGVTEKATRAAAISLRRHWPLIAVFLWTAGVGALYVRCPGCLDRARDNRSCEWTGDTTARLDLRQPADWQHLVLDAQLAEGLAGRFADAASLKINGVEGHGGLIDDGALVRECRTRMFATIEANHRVGADQIEAARAQRRAPFDAAVLLLFLPLYWLGATLVDRRLRHRFASDPHLVRWVATAIASGTVAIVGAQLADLWSMLWELIRVGNDHIGGHRLASFARPTEQHPAAPIVIGILLFWLVDVFNRLNSAVQPPRAALTLAGFDRARQRR
jgi:hypothetical protein